MNRNKNNIIQALIFSMFVIIGYLVTYNNKMLFFLVFVGERMYSFGAKEGIDSSLDEFNLEEGKKTIGLIIFLILAIVCIYLYSSFKYPYILIILILGDILDYSIYRAYKKHKVKKE
ncbi:hypothetical protein [Romboutsia ilealis]|uniref:hypothetical protein n=1 Tax=Romboutsia ilealis TaxID=1115758 RepID=UPI0025B76C8D|nr:hypothetical protein [Romboutsia ilealis]